MPGITDPAEEYFKDGLWAWDPAGGVWLKLIIDPLTNRLVVDHPGDIEVVQPVPADLCVANYGWDGAAWRKLPLIWGYSDRYAETVSNLSAVAGVNILLGTVVPPGQVWVVQSIAASDNTSVAGTLTLEVFGAAVEGMVKYDAALVAGAQTVWTGNIVMLENDRVRAVFTGCTLNDDLYLRTWGYKMRIAA